MPELPSAVEAGQADSLRPRRRRLTGIRLGLCVIGWLIVAGLAPKAR